MLLANTGATTLFLLLHFSPRFPTLFPYPSLFRSTTSALSVVSIFVLLRSYREQPADLSGFWHLTLFNLLAVTFFNALELAVFMAFWPDRLATVGIGVALGTGVAYVACLLIAARQG